jgi:RNA polymerase sigma-70 factor, ECF subfamily
MRLAIEMSSVPDVTQLLEAANSGDPRALAQVMPLVYDELHRLAEAYLRQERPGHTLQATALVNEAYLKLVDQTRIRWQNRAQFLGVAATAMRRILVNHALSRQSLKRGGSNSRVVLGVDLPATDDSNLDLVALDEAMKRLAAIDERKARVVELRYFGGLSVEDVAEVLAVAPATIKRDWTLAKTWLLREISKGDHDAA